MPVDYFYDSFNTVECSSDGPNALYIRIVDVNEVRNPLNCAAQRLNLFFIATLYNFGMIASSATSV